MAKRDDLEAAAAANVIAPEQVGPLYDFLATRASGAPQTLTPRLSPSLGGEEDLRFIRNFHDVFLSIGIVIFAFGLMAAGFTFLAGAGAFSFDEDVSAWPLAIMFGGCAAAQWGLAEIFAKRRRLFLPSIVLCLAFVGFGTFAASGALGELIIRPLVANTTNVDLSDGVVRVPIEGRLYPLLVLMSALGMTALFFARFRLPFSMGLMGFLGALALLAVWFVASPNSVLDALPLWSLIAGAILFGLGVLYDARDPERKTLLSDNGFWLHFAAAPLILNGVLSLTAGTGFWREALGETASLTPAGSEVGGAVITLVVVMGLGLVSLLINRRALIVSALLTTGAAIGVLVNEIGLDFGGFIAVTLLLLGGAVLLLGAGWHTARRALLGWVKPDGGWARVFPPEAAAE